MSIEITDELLETIYERVRQVFYAKKGYNPDSVELYDNGVIYCSKSWNVSYGNVEVGDAYITAKDLNADLDEIIKAQKIKDELERQEQEAASKRREAEYRETKRKERLATYQSLAKEFGPL